MTTEAELRMKAVNSSLEEVFDGYVILGYKVDGQRAVFFNGGMSQAVQDGLRAWVLAALHWRDAPSPFDKQA